MSDYGDNAISGERPHKYCFGDHVFDAQRLELLKAGSHVALRIQPARLLLLLLENAPHTVSRKTLQERIWDNGTTVEFDQGLNACINQLRTVLGDSANSATYIETQPKRGYRFVAPVEKMETAEAPAKRYLKTGMIAVFAAVAVTAVIAVVFLFHGQPKPTRLYIAPVIIEGDELAEVDPIAQYALRVSAIERVIREKRSGLQVINGETLWSQPVESGEPTQFDYSLGMKVANAGAGYVVIAQIKSGKSLQTVASQTFDLNGVDANSLFSAASRIQDWTVRVIGAEPLKDLPPDNDLAPQYYEAMLRARRTMMIGQPEALTESLSWFNRALDLNPSSVEALGGKAIVLAVLAGGAGYPSSATYQQVMDIAQNIGSVSGPTAHSELARGFVLLYRDWDLAGARAAFDLAAQLAPGDALVQSWRAGVLAAQGELDAAAEAANLAAHLDPLSMPVNSDRCWYLGAADRFDNATDACLWALEIEPDHDWSRVGLAAAYEALERFDDAAETIAPIWSKLALDKPDVRYNELHGEARFEAMSCAIADALSRRAADGTFPYFQLAGFEAQCKDFQSVTSSLLKAKQGGESGVLFFKDDPRFDDYRQSGEARSADLRIRSRV